MRRPVPRASGFTIVELLIVIVVIGILAAIVLNSFSNSQKQARDAKRMTDLTAIVKAVRSYGASTGAFPAVTANPGIDGWEVSTDPAGSFIESLVTARLFNEVPVDPTNNSQYTYRYYRYAGGSYNCNGGQSYFVVAIEHTEQYGNAKHPKSPGWACSSRDWQSEFSWVTGGYIE
ncbi:prepilin-type N-terminal cleavage/methylation domain-containing protein [Candidatus Saccharibacteria bacterium]|nr:prepilin-type N-terminal cleavage/methylation domain-containing protein [Candidatus Saccharibacteria bacterium]